MTKQTFSANLEYYKVFYYVARCGSFTGAAEQLFLTQPSVTKSIQRLEEQLGCPLFVRTKRGVHLTAEGQALWKRVEPACRLLLSAEQELAAVRQLEGGSLSIASTEMSFKTYVLPALEHFVADHPNVKVKFRNALTSSILEMLRTGAVDLAILHSPLHLEEGMEMHTLDVIQECFVVGPRYSFLAQRENELSDLIGYPFVSMPEGSSTKAYLHELFQAEGLEFEPDIEVTTMELAIQAVEHDFGIGTLPWRVVKDRVAKGSLFRLPLVRQPPERGAFVITNRRMPASLAAQAFLKEYLIPLI